MILDNYNPFKKHIFKDKQGKVVYYDYQTHIAYYIPDDKLNKYKVYTNRWMIALTFTVLAVGFIMELPFAIVCGLVIDLAMAFSFKRKFLPSLVKKDNIRLEQLLPFDPKSAKTRNKKQNDSTCFLIHVICNLLVINAYDQNLMEINVYSFYLSIGVAVLSAGISLYHVYRIFK